MDYDIVASLKRNFAFFTFSVSISHFKDVSRRTVKNVFTRYRVSQE